MNTPLNDHAMAFEFYRSFIEWYAKQMGPRLYVEIGCHTGGLIGRVAPYCERAIGVDILAHEDWMQHCLNNTNLEFRPLSSDTFFTNDILRHDIIDLCFIDGDHSAEQVYKDTLNAMNLLSPNGTIILHDTNPPDLEHTAPELCHTAFKALGKLESIYAHASWQFYTFPVRYGLTIISRVPHVMDL